MRNRDARSRRRDLWFGILTSPEWTQILNDIIADLVASAIRIRAQAGVYEQQDDKRASLLRYAANQLDVIISRLEGRL